MPVSIHFLTPEIIGVDSSSFRYPESQQTKTLQVQGLGAFLFLDYISALPDRFQTTTCITYTRK
jgi:hypothetical protein